MKKVGFAGSFDPMTKGHQWVIEEALSWSERVTVIVARHPDKKGFFSVEERVELIKGCLQEMGCTDRVDIYCSEEEYVATVAKELGCERLVRGIRSAVDFDYEHLIQRVNIEVLGGLPTLFVMPPAQMEAVSSSFVKGLMGPAGWHEKVRELVGPTVLKGLMWKWLQKEVCARHLEVETKAWESLWSDLQKAYNRPERVYHGVEHLVDLWSQRKKKEKEGWDILKTPALTWALLGHDWIQGEAQRKDEQLGAFLSDEGHSARKMGLWMKQWRVADADMVQRCIEATEHGKDHDLESDSLEAYFVDLDVAVLSRDEKGYAHYRQQIEQEYQPRYTPEQYRQGRVAILSRFVVQMQSQQWLKTEMYRKEQERALKNVKEEIRSLCV